MNWKKYWSSPLNILMFAIIGVAFGLLLPSFADNFKVIGDIFIKLLRMLIVPIVFLSILSSMIKLKHSQEGGSIATVKAGTYFLGLTILAAVFGALVSTYIPVTISTTDIPAAFMNGVDLYQNQVPQSHGVGEYILNLIPSNILAAFSSDNILQVVLFSIFLGLGFIYYPGEGHAGIENAVAVLSEVLGWMMKTIMLIVPLAVFSLIYYTVAASGFNILYNIGTYFIIYMFCIIFWVYVVLGLLVKYVGQVSWLSWVKNIFPLQIFALSTSSSLVCMPLNIQTAEVLGAPKRESSIIIPIGTTLNLQATAMYYIMSAIFFGKIFGIHFELAEYVAMVVTASLGAASAAGIPGTSLLIAAVFVSGGVPLTALPLLFACDRFFDMVTTVGNVLGNTAVPILVQKKNKKEIEKL